MSSWYNIFDFGGGTFDVTVLSARGRSCEVLSIRGRRPSWAVWISTICCMPRRRKFFSEGLGMWTPTRILFLSTTAHGSFERAKIELHSLKRILHHHAFPNVVGLVSHPSHRSEPRPLEELVSPLSSGAWPWCARRPWRSPKRPLGRGRPGAFGGIQPHPLGSQNARPAIPLDPRAG